MASEHSGAESRLRQFFRRTLWPRTGAGRRRIRRRLRLAAAGSLLAPGLYNVGSDLLRRGRYLAHLDDTHLLGYVASVGGSLLLWAGLLYVATGRRGLFRQLGAGVFTLLFTLAVGGQAAFFALFDTYQTLDGQFYTDSIPLALVSVLPFERPAVVFHFMAAVVLAIGFLVLARRLVRPRPWFRRLSPLVAAPLVAGAFNVPVSYRSVLSSSPDLIYFHSLSALVGEHFRAYTTKTPHLARVERRHPLPVPRLTAAPARPRNVVLLLQEAQRADMTCTEYDPKCPLATPATNDLLPDRMALLQMRSCASSTAVAISNLWSGIDPTDTKDHLLSAPLLWEYARAAGYDTAYWTSQHLIFGNSRLYIQDLPLSRFADATSLEQGADWLVGARDALLGDRVVEEIDELKEPWFAVVHFSNNHRPRLVEARHAPFQPANLTDKGTGDVAGKNHYKNSIYLSDLAAAKIIRHLRETDAGKRTVILYTSDHAESFYEHHNENDHSGSVFDEEIRVPAWIDAPPGTMSPTEEQNIRSAKKEILWQFDIGATILDLLGVWDDPGLRPFRAPMIGHPITRSERTTGPVPMTNTSWIWEYQYANWGMMQGSLKVLAFPSANTYRCYDVLTDVRELHDLGEAKCPQLAAIARAHFELMPSESRNLTLHPSWPKR